MNIYEDLPYYFMYRYVGKCWKIKNSKGLLSVKEIRGKNCGQLTTHICGQKAAL